MAPSDSNSLETMTYVKSGQSKESLGLLMLMERVHLFPPAVSVSLSKHLLGLGPQV